MCTLNFRKLFYVLPLFLFSCINIVDGTVGQGRIVSQNVAVSSFNTVENASSAKVEIVKGESFLVELSDYENLIELWDIKVINNRLLIQVKPFSSLVNTHAYVRITMPDELYDVKTAGSGNVELNAAFTNLSKVTVSGSGSVYANQSTDYADLILNISGSGNINMSGTVGKLNTTTAGSGKMYLDDLLANEAACMVAGSGNVYLLVDVKLNAVIVGSGNVYYSGNPVLNVTDTGSGNVRRK